MVANSANVPGEFSSARRRAITLIGLGIFIDGYDLLVIGTANLFLKSALHLSASQVGLVGSAGVFGALVGMLLFGNLTDRFGRKTIFVFNLMFFVVASILSAFVTNSWELIVMRLVVGLGIGADIPTAMAFLAEVSSKQRRGAILGSLTQGLWTGGAIVSVAVALVVSHFAGPSTWRWLLGLGAVPALVILILRQKLPESPRWLMNRGKVQEAEIACQRLGITYDEFKEMERVRNSKEKISGTGWGKKISLVALVFWLNALAGAVSTISSPYIFKYVSHATLTGSMLFTLMLWAANFLGVVAGSFIIDKISHKSLALISQIPTIAFALIMALTVKDAVIFIPAFFLFGFFDWGGASALQWAWGSEIFPTQFRGFSQGIINGAGRFAVIITTYLIPVAIATIGFSWAMVIMAVPVVLYCVIVASNSLFETKGLSLEDIEMRESSTLAPR